MTQPSAGGEIAFKVCALTPTGPAVTEFLLTDRSAEEYLTLIGYYDALNADENDDENTKAFFDVSGANPLDPNHCMAINMQDLVVCKDLAKPVVDNCDKDNSNNATNNIITTNEKTPKPPCLESTSHKSPQSNTNQSKTNTNQSKTNTNQSKTNTNQSNNNTNRTNTNQSNNNTNRTNTNQSNNNTNHTFGVPQTSPETVHTFRPTRSRPSTLSYWLNAMKEAQ